MLAKYYPINIFEKKGKNYISRFQKINLIGHQIYQFNSVYFCHQSSPDNSMAFILLYSD